jgi:hypothetical protein
MPTQDVKIATQSEIDQCVATIVLAFSSDPAPRWLYADPHAFFDNFPRFVRVFGGEGFRARIGSPHCRICRRAVVSPWRAAR